MEHKLGHYSPSLYFGFNRSSSAKQELFENVKTITSLV